MKIHFSVDNTIVICGAGISFNSGLPSGYKIVETINNLISNHTFEKRIQINELFKEYNEKVISEILGTKTSLYSYPRLEAIFNAIKGTLDESSYNNFIKHTLYKDCIDLPVFCSDIHFELAEFIMSKGKVLTANFDQLIEKALEELNASSYNKFIFPNPQLSINENEGTLVKYHGDIEDSNSIGIDLSKLTINGFDDSNTLLLNEIFKNISKVLFIGFSVSDTLDLVPYLQTLSNVEYFYLNYQKRPSLNRIENWEQIANDENILEPFNYFCKESKQEGYHLFEAYEENSIFKIRKSAESHVLLNSSNLDYQKLLIEISKTDFADKIYISILTNFGLLNLLSENDKRRLPDFSQARSYLNNINGNYEIELDEIRSREGLDRFYSHHYFIKLQEYIFLKKGKLLYRIVKIPLLIIIFLLIRITKPQSKSENLELNYSLNLFTLRIFQSAINLSVLKWFIPKFIVERYLERMESQLILCKEVNNLKMYRFTLKELWYVKCYFGDLIDIDGNENYQSFQELIKLNADSNYLLDINNLIRTALIFIGKRISFSIGEQSCIIIGDSLNLEKLRIIFQTKSKK